MKEGGARSLGYSSVIGCEMTRGQKVGCAGLHSYLFLAYASSLNHREWRSTQYLRSISERFIIIIIHDHLLFFIKVKASTTIVVVVIAKSSLVP